MSIFHRLTAFFRKSPLDRELNAEIAAHIELATEENIRAGMSPADARRKALSRFGGIDQARQAHRESRGLPGLDRLLQDLRYTFRTLKRDAGFTTIAVLILALGISANIVVFSLVNTLLLRPLPFWQPRNLVAFSRMSNNSGLSGATYSSDAYDDLRAMNHSYADVTGYDAFYSPNNAKLDSNHGIPTPATAVPVVDNFFHVFGITPMLGRDFLPADSANPKFPVAMLTYAFWKSQYHGDPGIVGKTVSINKTPVPIIGVLPPSFDFGSIFTPGSKVDMFFPQNLDDIRYNGNELALFGRIKPGVSLAQAQAEALELFPQFYWGKRQPGSKGAYGKGKVTLIKDHVAGQLRRSLYVLWAAVGMILLIVCVNLSNLMLARAAARNKEFALRVALGAGRGRLIRQLLTEASVLSFLGALFGLGIAYAVTGWLAHQGSLALPLLSSLRVDNIVLLWTLAIAVLTSLLFGLAPGLKMAGANLQESLKDSGTQASEGRKHDRLRTTLVISQVALACVLVVGAGLLLRSFMHVLDVDLGFRPAQASALSLDLPQFFKDDKDRNANYARQTAYFHSIVDSVATVPGIQAVGVTDSLPFSLNRTWSPPDVKGVQYSAPGKPDPRPSPFIYVVTPGLLQSMGTPVRGRDFAWSDDDAHELVVILNQTAADYLFPNHDALGRVVSVGGQDNVRIIGIVPNVHETNLETDPGWQVYLSMGQNKWGPNSTQLVVRSSLPIANIAPSILQKVRAINPAQPGVSFLSIQSYVDHATSPRRFFAMLVGIFAALGLLLASLGIYGVISYGVTRQTQEIGIRMALGATREKVQRDVIVRTLRLAGIGILVGTAASFVVAQAIRSLLFGTEPHDTLTFAAMVALLTVVALLAGYIPARRASKIDPMVALRSN